MLDYGACIFWGLIFGSFLLFLKILRRELRAGLSEQREWLLNISLCVVVSLSIFLALEVAFRVRHLVVRGIPFFSSLAQYQHNEFGWIGREHFGDLNTTKQKVLFVGDSFTNGMGLADSQMYYQVLADTAGIEPFVYAGAGYGTLQEFLVLRHYLPLVKPDLIVLQVCTNDFINNYWQLDSASYHNNTLLPRPYWIDGEIQYIYPRHFAFIRSFLPRHSRFFHFLFTKVELLQLRAAKAGYLHSVEEDIIRDGDKFPSFAASIAVTEKLIQDIKTLAGDTPLVAFSVDYISPYSEEFAKIFARNGIAFIQDIPGQIAEQEKQGDQLRIADGVHWNEAGQLVAGYGLLRALREKEFLKTAGQN